MLLPHQAQDLVKWAGSKSAAARAIGVPPTTFRHWLDPEPGRARQRRARAEGRAWDQRPENDERVAARKSDWWFNLPITKRVPRELKERHRKALIRIAERNAGRDEDDPVRAAVRAELRAELDAERERRAERELDSFPFPKPELVFYRENGHRRVALRIQPGERETAAS